MKKTLLFAAAVLALAACSKESPVKEEGAIDASKLVFNIDVRYGNDTKGVKTAWEDGDDVYVFFEDNTTQYVKMTYNGSSWTYSTFEGLVLVSDGKLSAVYMPDFVCSDAPTYDSENGRWTFGSIAGYYQKAEGVSYTLTVTPDEDPLYTLSATISLEAPANIMQFYVPSSAVAAPGTGNEYALTATHVINYTFDGIVPGGIASQGNELNGGAMQGYGGTLGGDTGYYFWGILEGTGNYTYDFQLVKRNAEKKYAISSYSATKNPGVSISSAAFKLTNLTDNGNFVSLGYTGGPLWATGNLEYEGWDNIHIGYPTIAGSYYMFGQTTPYDTSQEDNLDAADDPLQEEYDAAHAANSSWRMPTKAEFDALCELSYEWDSTLQGLMFTGANGIKVFFYAAGNFTTGINPGGFEPATDDGSAGYYWSSTPLGRAFAYYLYFSGYDAGDGTFMADAHIDYSSPEAYCREGKPIRPVKN